MSELKSYAVTIPFAGAISVGVDAENEEQAIEKAKEVAGNEISFDISKMRSCDIIEWDLYDKMTSGNIRHYNYNEIETQEI